MNNQPDDLPIPAIEPNAGIIDNGANGGTVQLGVNPPGNLLTFNGLTLVGMVYIPTGGEVLTPGVPREGWGVANGDANTGIFTAFTTLGGGSVATNLIIQPESGVTNPTGFIQPDSNGSAYRSVTIDTTNRVRVTHDFTPSPSNPNYYNVDVTIENIGQTPIGDLQYRRVQEWDVPLTEFNEWTEFHVDLAEDLNQATNAFLNTANPLVPVNPIGPNFFTLNPGDPDRLTGPFDQSSTFDFHFGQLLPGASKRFTLFYGASETRDEALSALNDAGAQAWSIGYPNEVVGGQNQPAFDGPNVFFFGYRPFQAESPTIFCSNDITRFITSGINGAFVTFPTPTVISQLGVSVTCNPASGSFFRVGITNVICTATDTLGNSASCSFIVRVLPAYMFHQPGGCRLKQESKRLYRQNKKR